MSSSLQLANESSRWDSARAGDYDTKWQQMAAAGENPHGEVDFVLQLCNPGSVLDAGCGTGRVAIEFAARGFDAVGTDIDESMLAVALEKAPNQQWVQSDLAALSLDRTFDAVVLAGNIILFVAPGTEADVVAGAARHVAPGGNLLAGFSMGRGVSADDWEGWLRAAGLAPAARYSTWTGDDFTATSDYLVSHSTRPFG